MHCMQLTVFGGREIRVRSNIFRVTLLWRATLIRNLQARSVSYRLGLFVLGFVFGGREAAKSLPAWRLGASF